MISKILSAGLLASALAYPSPPSGGVGVSPNDPAPVYSPETDFDTESLVVGVNQEWLELDLFHNMLATFSEEEFDAAGINAEQRYYIQEMAEQEVGHAILINNMLAGAGKTSQQCQYKYPYKSVKEALSFAEFVTRFGEAGVYGFLPHLKNRAVAQNLLQSITTEAKQEVAMAQMEGYFPQPYWFNMGLTQAMTWSLMVPFLDHCPESNPKVAFPAFPLLDVTNAAKTVDESIPSGVSNNYTHVAQPGRQLDLKWAAPGQDVGPPEQGYKTDKNPDLGDPAYAAFIHQLNVTYTPLENVNTEELTATTIHPDFKMFNEPNGMGINGTVFLAIVDEEVPVTPYNFSLLNDHIHAFGPYFAAMGTSHLEYGFPSTHSTTAVAQALVLNNWLSDATADGSVDPFTMSVLRTLLIIATSSVVFGRFYCGMHSALDCFSGVITGTMIYITRSYIGPYYEAFIEQSTFLTPILLTILSLYAIHAHIEPAEDNPAFEDSVAFISVFLGNGIGEWIACNYGFHHSTYFVTKLTGWEWCLASLFKYPLGVGLIFLTRILCKPIMQAVLPPLFRLLHKLVKLPNKLVKLPNRKGYVPATEYESYNPTSDTLNPIPSVVDLAQLKHVKETHNSKQATEIVGEERPTISQTTHRKFSPRHYDADVMTRVVSYAAMGFVGTIIAPIIFEKLGWGLF
ncbi:Rds1 protein [Wallemia mellicola]|nr:Rds1 protein [Wallemia mellicola]TIC73454.1 Rds1 protein [Wallemia mellicola]